MAVRAKNGEILARLNVASKKHKIQLNYYARLTYIAMVDYAIEHGEEVENGVSHTLTVEEIAEVAGFSPRYVVSVLDSLVAVGAVVRIKGVDTFPRSPHKTILVKEYYEDKEGEKDV